MNLYRAGSAYPTISDCTCILIPARSVRLSSDRVTLHGSFAGGAASFMFYKQSTFPLYLITSSVERLSQALLFEIRFYDCNAIARSHLWSRLINKRVIFHDREGVDMLPDGKFENIWTPRGDRSIKDRYHKQASTV